jgi:hypothetical protein
MKLGGGIIADRQLRWMQSVLLKTLSLRNRMRRIVIELQIEYTTYANLVRRVAAVASHPEWFPGISAAS